MRLSGWRVLREGLTGNKAWQPHWQDATPRAEYDAIIIGGGGHGLSTAYYLAKAHGLTDIAVLEKDSLAPATLGATRPSCAPITSSMAIPSSILIRSSFGRGLRTTSTTT